MKQLRMIPVIGMMRVHATHSKRLDAEGHNLLVAILWRLTRMIQNRIIHA